jgi:arylformamidase
MDRDQFVKMMADAKLYDLTQGCSIFTPPWPGEKALEIHFFKRITGAMGGGHGANGQVINWSNTVGTHLVGETAFHSGGRAISDIPLKDLSGQGVIADISDQVGDYDVIEPEMIENVVTVKKGDILIINTGYNRYSWDMPDTINPDAQGGVEGKEFGFLVRHPGPSMRFYLWALEKKLKLIGVDCGAAEHPMNTPIRYLHGNHFKIAAEKLMQKTGKKWDEMFPPDKYYQITHHLLPEAHLIFVECIVGQINELSNQRCWITVQPAPFVETEAAWTRVAAWTSPQGMDAGEFFRVMDSAEMIDMTLPLSVRTPQWANFVPLSISFNKRVSNHFFGMGRNMSTCTASFHLGSHMDGEKHFYPAGRTFGQVPLEEWVGPGVIADISNKVSDSSVYTPKMIEDALDGDIREGDILIIITGYSRFGWNSSTADEFRYMIKHPGPSNDFANWAATKKIKWIGIDCASADHPMNTIMRNWHPITFQEANEKLKKDFGKEWDEMFPLDKYYQDMHLNLFSRHILHAENLAGAIATATSGRYYIGFFGQKAIEAESMWGRFVAFKA